MKIKKIDNHLEAIRYAMRILEEECDKELREPDMACVKQLNELRADLMEYKWKKVQQNERRKIKN